MRPVYLLAMALVALMLPSALVLGVDYLQFRAWRAEQQAQHTAYMSTVNGVTVGLGNARTRIVAEGPDVQGREIWLDTILSRKGCATLQMVATGPNTETSIKVDCLDPETGAPIPGLTRARLWPENEST